MNIPFLNLFVLLESLLLLAIGLVYTIRLQKQERQLKEELKNAHKSAEKLLERAQMESQNILKHALQKAEEMVDKTDVYTENLEAHLENNLREKSTDVTKLFGKAVIDMKNDYVREISESFKSLEEEGKKQMSEFQVLLKNEGMTHKSYIDRKMDEEFESAKAEIEAFKKAKIHEAEEKIDKQVNAIAKEVLGKSLSSKDQEKLIIEALEKAKNDGLFG